MSVYAGSLIKAEYWPATAREIDTTTQVDVDDTSFVTGSPTVDVTFVAPTSGAVLIHVNAGLRGSGTASHRILVVPNVFLGTDALGTEVLATSGTTTEFELTSPGEATSYMYSTRSYPLSGLTAGSTYYARLMQKGVAGSTADIFNREIIVRPLT